MAIHSPETLRIEISMNQRKRDALCRFIVDTLNTPDGQIPDECRAALARLLEGASRAKAVEALRGTDIEIPAFLRRQAD